MVPVARRWKGQFNELAKTWASYDALPEADHNTLAGSIFPEDDLVRQFVLFLQSPSDPERNRLRLRLTRRAFMLQGLSTDEFTVQGNTRLAQLWSGVIAGDLVAYFLAIAYGVDPTPIAPIENFKSEMRSVA
jgi:glucose/mannose-6-phosphate isomerase